MSNRSDHDDRAPWLLHQSQILLADLTAPGQTRVAGNVAGCGREMTAPAIISVHSRTLSVSGSAKRRAWSRLVPCMRLRLCRWVAARDRHLIPSVMECHSARIAPELIGVQASVC
jgi:hypothetical protein